MMNVEKIYKLLLGPRGDRYTLLTTLLLTVLVDLNTAISVGFIMASVIFMHRMSREIEIETDEEVLEDVGGGRDLAEVPAQKRRYVAAFVRSVVFRRRFAGLPLF